MRLPDEDAMSPEQREAEVAILPPEQRKILESLYGKEHADVFPERQRAWERERAQFATVLERYEVDVLRPRLLTRWEKAAAGPMGYSNSFVRDPWFTIGSFVIEGSLRFLHRRAEVLASRPIFQERVYPANCTYVSVPGPEIVPLDADSGGPGPFIEGGDVLIYDKRVFVGISGRASTQLGARWLEKLLAPHGYTIEVVPLRSNVLHLDCALGLVREGLLVACEELMPRGIPAVLRDWERIAATPDEAAALGTNGLPVSPDVYVTDPVFKRIGDEIAARGVHVEYVDFTISRSFGGAFRCSTQPLRRE
jgi:glycine amidinotransferase